MRNSLSRFVGDEAGATSIEYSLIAALIGLTLIAASRSVGTEVSAVFSDASTGLQGRSR